MSVMPEIDVQAILREVIDLRRNRDEEKTARALEQQQASAVTLKYNATLFEIKRLTNELEIAARKLEAHKARADAAERALAEREAILAEQKRAGDALERIAASVEWGSGWRSRTV